MKHRFARYIYRFARYIYRFVRYRYPSKHFVWRHLQDISPRRLQNMGSRRFSEMSSIRLEDVFSGKMFCLQDIFETSLQGIMKKSSRCLEDILADLKLLCWRRIEDVLKTCLENVLKTPWRPTNVCGVTFFRIHKYSIQFWIEPLLNSLFCYILTFLVISSGW